MNDREFDLLWEKLNGRKAGRGDSPYTQEFYERTYGITKERKVKKR